MQTNEKEKLNESHKNINKKKDPELTDDKLNKVKNDLNSIKTSQVENLIEDTEDNNKENDNEGSIKESIYNKRTQKSESFSFWNVDVFFHNQNKHVNIIVRYFVEIVFVSVLLLCIPFIGVSFNSEKFSFDQLINNDWTNLGKWAILLKKNFLLAVFYLADTIFILMSECIVNILTRILILIDLDSSELFLGIVTNIYIDRKYIRSTLSLFFIFILLIRINGPYRSPTLDLNMDIDKLIALVLWIAISSSIFFIVRFFTHMFTFNIKRNAYRSSIRELNFQSFIFRKLKVLSEATKQGPEYVKVMAKELDPEYDLGYFLQNKDLFSSEEDAENVAKNIFALLEKKSIQYEDIQEYFPNSSQSVFRYLSGSDDFADNNNVIQIKQFIILARDLYIRKQDMARSMRDRDSVFEKLDLVFGVIAAYGCIIILLLMFQAEYKVFITSFGTSLITFSWVFADSIKALYNCFIFLLIIRPYDIGDRVKVDEEDLVVFKVDLLTTTFLTQYNKLVYHPNTELIKMRIYNIARSPPQKEVIELTVDPLTTFEQAIRLGETVENNLKSEKKYIEACVFKQISCGKLTYIIHYTKNFQNYKQLKRNRNKITKIFEQSLINENISYSNSFLFSDS